MTMMARLIKKLTNKQMLKLLSIIFELTKDVQLKRRLVISNKRKDSEPI